MSFSNLANPIDWDLQSTYWRSQMTELKVKEVWTSVCKPWMQSPEMWPGGIKALKMMLDDHWILWSSFENTLASNSTHCRVWKVIGLIRFSRLEHVAAWWSTTVDYHHIPPPYSTIIHHVSFAVWSCTRIQAETAYSEDHNLSSHGSHAPSCTTSFFRGGTNEADQEEVQDHHSMIWNTMSCPISGWFVAVAGPVHIGELQMSSRCSTMCFSKLPNVVEWGCKALTAKGRTFLYLRRIGLPPFFLKSMEALSLTCHQGELNWELLTTPLTLKEMPSGSCGVFSHLDPFSGGSDRMYVSHWCRKLCQSCVTSTFSSWTRKNCPTFSHDWCWVRAKHL